MKIIGTLAVTAIIVCMVLDGVLLGEGLFAPSQATASSQRERVQLDRISGARYGRAVRLVDSETGCEYLRIRSSISPRYAADGRTVMGCTES